ncbi:MAG: hypothetical protein IJ702_02715 [Fretibacterium sp.]|nr:hypothetical protein [Fretibacterium sp.]
MKMRSGLKDFAAFGRVLSTALAVAGYVFLGVWLSNWLQTNGYPIWLSLAALLLTAAFGLWQGWLFLTRPTGREKDKQ